MMWNGAYTVMIKIPEFKTIEDMARFWDNHDITDFEDQLIDVKLDSEQYEKLKKIAHQKKLNTLSLVSQWVTRQIEVESNQRLR